ncbi:rCG63457, partial [Rattus norvegicus]
MLYTIWYTVFRTDDSLITSISQKMQQRLQAWKATLYRAIVWGSPFPSRGVYTNEKGSRGKYFEKIRAIPSESQGSSL